MSHLLRPEHRKHSAGALCIHRETCHDAYGARTGNLYRNHAHLLLHCVYCAQGGVNVTFQLRSIVRAPILIAWITPLEETKVHDSGADSHCVLHMHHDKSLDACIMLLHCVYGA